MGVLTEAMMRLRGEIGAWRHERAALQNDLVRQTDERRTGVSALCAAFARDRAGAHRAWSGPTLSERRAAERQRRLLAEEATAKAEQERERQRLAEEAKAKAEQERERQRLAEEAKVKAEQERERQRLAEEAKAKAEREREQQRLAEEAKAKAKREEQLPATVKSRPHGHDAVQPVAHTQGTPLKGLKKH